jgi:hypothetical protein
MAVKRFIPLGMESLAINKCLVIGEDKKLFYNVFFSNIFYVPDGVGKIAAAFVPRKFFPDLPNTLH